MAKEGFPCPKVLKFISNLLDKFYNYVKFVSGECKMSDLNSVLVGLAILLAFAIMMAPLVILLAFRDQIKLENRWLVVGSICSFLNTAWMAYVIYTLRNNMPPFIMNPDHWLIHNEIAIPGMIVFPIFCAVYFAIGIAGLKRIANTM